MKKGFIAPLILGIVIIALVVGGMLVYKSRTSNQPESIPTTESSPSPSADETAKCQSPDTRTFNSNQQTNWEAFANHKYCYSFMYPSQDYELSSGLGPADDKSGSVLVDQKGVGYPGFSIFYVNVYVKDGSPTGVSYNGENISNYLTTKIGETVSSRYGPFKRLNDTRVGGQTAKVFEGYAYGYRSDFKPDAKSLKDRRIFLERGETVYVIGTYYPQDETGEKWKIYNQILSTFKFTQ